MSENILEKSIGSGPTFPIQLTSGSWKPKKGSLELIEDNIKLKQEIRNLRSKFDVIRESSSPEVTNSDLLRRLSNLEKAIYGRDE